MFRMLFNFELRSKCFFVLLIAFSNTFMSFVLLFSSLDISTNYINNLPMDPSIDKVALRETIANILAVLTAISLFFHAIGWFGAWKGNYYMAVAYAVFVYVQYLLSLLSSFQETLSLTILYLPPWMPLLIQFFQLLLVVDFCVALRRQRMVIRKLPRFLSSKV